MKRTKRLFTLEEVNALIPRLEELLSHLRAKKALYDRRHDAVFLHELLTEIEQSTGLEDEAALALEKDFCSLEEDLQDLGREIKKVTSLGCLVHDLESGCVDFPGQLKGKKVFFCWQCGEKTVRYYHSEISGSRELLPSL